MTLRDLLNVKNGSGLKKILVTDTWRTTMGSNYFRFPYFHVYDGLDSIQSYDLSKKEQKIHEKFSRGMIEHYLILCIFAYSEFREMIV